jgi:hypothetical protein
MRKLFICLLVTLISGCIGPHGAMKELPEVSSEENAGNIYLLRNGNFFGGGVNYVVTLDFREIFGIGVNEYTKFKVEQGGHHIGVICKGGWTPGTHVDEKYADIKAGKTYYFMARAGGICAVIEPLTEQEGEKMVAKAKYVPIYP